MSTSQERDIDGLFHRAVDIVQSLPKGGPVQTSYEEKLWLYSLYKQGTEGDISIPRPGMLDMLGKAKWDSWNKQKGIDKIEAKRLYVNALLKILRKYSQLESVQRHLSELDSFGSTSSVHLPNIDRPVSPASSTSSYHSSQASPPPTTSQSNVNVGSSLNVEPVVNRRQDRDVDPPNYAMLPPDPLLPPPDVAEDIVPPSALTSSHRSLLSLGQAYGASSPHPHSHNQFNSRSQTQDHSPHQLLIDPIHGHGSPIAPTPGLAQGQAHGSRAHSLAGGRGGSVHDFRPTVSGSGRDSVHSFRQRPYFTEPDRHSGNVPFQARSSRQYTNVNPNPNMGTQLRGSSPHPPAVRDFVGVHPETPDQSPYLGVHAPTPIYLTGGRPGGPGSTSTFSHLAPAPLNVGNTLQQIQISLTALHERLSTLERTQAMILRKEERKKGWFWTSREEHELDEVEDQYDEYDTAAWNRAHKNDGPRPRSAGSGGSGGERRGTTTITRIRKRPLKLSTRVLFYLLGILRRAMVDVSVGVIIFFVIAVVVGRGGGIGGFGWRKARGALERIKFRLRR